MLKSQVHWFFATCCSDIDNHIPETLYKLDKATGNTLQCDSINAEIREAKTICCISTKWECWIRNTGILVEFKCSVFVFPIITDCKLLWTVFSAGLLSNIYNSVNQTKLTTVSETWQCWLSERLMVWLCLLQLAGGIIIIWLRYIYYVETVYLLYRRHKCRYCVVRHQNWLVQNISLLCCVSYALLRFILNLTASLAEFSCFMRLVQRALVYCGMQMVKVFCYKPEVVVSNTD
jgi:hypothetical protein